jgi:hypothetical protein
MPALPSSAPLEVDRLADRTLPRRHSPAHAPGSLSSSALGRLGRRGRVSVGSGALAEGVRADPARYGQ